MADFKPSTVPGCRVPISFLQDGRPVYDALGPGYTLLRIDPDIAIAPLVEALREKGVPLELVDVENGASDHAYDRKLILVRTDQHVAWRGDTVPDDVEELVDLLRGVAAERGEAASAAASHLTANGA